MDGVRFFDCGLAVTVGRERTAAEYERLLAHGGLDLNGITPTRTSLIIEAKIR